MLLVTTGSISCLLCATFRKSGNKFMHLRGLLRKPKQRGRNGNKGFCERAPYFGLVWIVRSKAGQNQEDYLSWSLFGLSLTVIEYLIFLLVVLSRLAGACYLCYWSQPKSRARDAYFLHDPIPRVSQRPDSQNKRLALPSL
jgi:hypothetical protein